MRKKVFSFLCILWEEEIYIQSVCVRMCVRVGEGERDPSLLAPHHLLAPLRLVPVFFSCENAEWKIWE